MTRTKYLAGRANRLFEPFLGPNSLLLLDGARHRRERRLLMPPFHGERKEPSPCLLADVAAAACDVLPLFPP